MKIPAQKPSENARRACPLNFPRAFSALMCLIALSALSGCYGAHEISGLAIVMGVGIDAGGEPGTHLVTAQIAKPSALKSGESGGAGGADKAYVMARHEGDTVSSAIQGIAYMVSREPYFSHNQIIVIGRAVAERDIANALDFFVRDYEGRLTTLLVVADGRAEELLVHETEIEKLPAVQLHDMLELQKLTSACAPLTLREFLISTLSKTASPVAPIVELYKSKEGKTKARVGNTAVFKNGKMIGEFDKTQTRGMLWISGKTQTGILSADALGGRISFELQESSSSVEPVLKDGRFAVKVRIRQVLIVAEARASENIMKPESADRMNAAAREAIAREIKSAVDQAKALNADVFGFGEAIRRKYPVQSKQALENWDSEFPRLEVDLSVTASVRNTGSLTVPITPGGRP